MKCSYLLLFAALVSAVLATPGRPGGQRGASNDERDSPRMQDHDSQQEAVARSTDDLDPRLAFLPLIPGVFAAKRIAEQRQARKKPKRDLDFVNEVRALDNSDESGLQRRQNVQHDSAIMARTNELQPRLAFLPLIPAWGALRAIDKKQQQQRKNRKQRRRDLSDVYDA